MRRIKREKVAAGLLLMNDHSRKNFIKKLLFIFFFSKNKIPVFVKKLDSFSI